MENEKHTLNAPLIAAIETFIARHNMAESTFGRHTVKDWRLIRDLRNGRELRNRTLTRIHKFMADRDALLAS